MEPAAAKAMSANLMSALVIISTRSAPLPAPKEDTAQTKAEGYKQQ
jgi:hypothetical protein